MTAPCLLAALVLQTPACDRPAALAAVELGWQAYRRGEIAQAESHFAAAAAACPARSEAQTGLGFVRLRQGDAVGAERRFIAALRSDSSVGDPWYGLGLARDRLRRRAQAVAAWRRALAVAPGYSDALDALLAAGRGQRPAAATHHPSRGSRGPRARPRRAIRGARR